MKAKYLFYIATFFLLTGCDCNERMPKDGYSVFASMYGMMTCEAPSTMIVSEEQVHGRYSDWTLYNTGRFDYSGNPHYEEWTLRDGRRTIRFVWSNNNAQWDISQCASDHLQREGGNYYCSERTDSLIAFNSTRWNNAKPLIIVSSHIRSGNNFVCYSSGFTTEEHREITRTFQYRPQRR